MEETKRVLSKIDFDKFRQYIESRTGMYFDDSKQNSLKISIDSRMAALDIKEYSAYYSLIITNTMGKKEFDELLNIILIRETFFFRDDKQLKVLTKNILPELIKRKKEKEIKIWSAGCATGEEPYSIAMAIMECYLPDDINVSVYATDISEWALKRAKEGIYNKSSMRAVDKAMLNKYFTQRDGWYHLNDQVKQFVRFDTINLIEPFFPIEAVHVDIIFCKNVLIYFRTETVKTVIRKFYEMLAAGGYLFVGHSESLWQISDDFELEEISGIFIYRKDGKNRVASLTKRFQQKGKASGSINFTGKAPSSLVKKGSRHITLTPQAAGEKVSPQSVGLMHKKDVSKCMKKGVPPAGDDNYESVLEEIEEVLEGDPKNVDAHLLAGKLYANIGLYDKALKKGMDALEIDDLSADAYLLMGSIYYKIGEKEKAISVFKKTIYLDDNSVISHYYLGNLYKDAGLNEQAVNEYKNVIRIFEANPESKEWLVGEVFTVKQLKEICTKNIELLASVFSIKESMR
ncbi:MAG: tetratricopeptide repeat protein [Planctomycetes bacterium]|nr:tetratricopeptide repeat protein [Planctomycetota bacterium]